MDETRSGDSVALLTKCFVKTGCLCQGVQSVCLGQGVMKDVFQSVLFVFMKSVVRINVQVVLNCSGVVSLQGVKYVQE